MDPADVVVETQGLVKTFKRGKIRAVDGLNIEVRKGEIYGLVGPDGAGKSTTLRLLAAVMRPDSGIVRVAGRDAVRQGESLRRLVGYMPQRLSLYGDLSVQENLTFYADIFGVSQADRQVRMPRLLRFARLTEFRDRRAEHLSGGMRKKLGLACTLIHQPSVLYLDEPTTGVDPLSRREFWDILTELHLEGITLVVSTPYMDEADRCSRVALMYQGRIVVSDTPAQIKARLTADLIEFRPSDIRGARHLLADQPWIAELQTYGDLLHVFVPDAAGAIPRLRSTLDQAGIAAHDLRVTQPHMEEAFISLIRQQGLAHGDQRSRSAGREAPDEG
jgi:ABC-2 type transport system ATP-binding protein